MINSRTERKFGRNVLEIIVEIQETPEHNSERFILLKKKLEKAVARYQKYTGRDRLDPNVDYGYKLK